MSFTLGESLTYFCIYDKPDKNRKIAIVLRGPWDWKSSVGLGECTSCI